MHLFKTCLALFLLTSSFACNSFLESSSESAVQQQVSRAAIDFGSGAIKMQVANIDPLSNQVETLLTKQISINLTEDIASHNGTISPELIKKCYDILSQMKVDASEISGRDDVHFAGVATASFRKAKNGQELLDQFEKDLGIHFRILSQDEEGKLGFMTAKILFPDQPENQLIAWDNGNGSFQMTSEGNVYQGPTGFGVVRLLLSKDIRNEPVLGQGTDNPIWENEKEQLFVKIKAMLPPKPDWLNETIANKNSKIVTFGEGNSLFPVMAQSVAILRGHPEIVEEAVITLEDMYWLCDVYIGQTDDLFNQHKVYNRTLLGAIYVAAMMEYLGVDKIYYKRSLGNTPGMLIFPVLWE